MSVWAGATGLAFLAGGYTDQAGPAEFTEALKQITAKLLGYQNEAGYFDDGNKSRMYGHGFATLFLAELYGMSLERDQDIRGNLRRAIDVIEKSQSSEGGWDYHPALQFHRDLPLSREPPTLHAYSDTSITVCQTMALRAARNLGLEVSEAVVARAQKYITSAQNPDGGFRDVVRFSASSNALDTGWAAVALQLAGLSSGGTGGGGGGRFCMITAETSP